MAVSAPASSTTRSLVAPAIGASANHMDSRRRGMQEVLQNGEQVGHAVGGLAVTPALDDAGLAGARPGRRLVEQPQEVVEGHAGVAAQVAGTAETRARRIVPQFGAQGGDLGRERLVVHRIVGLRVALVGLRRHCRFSGGRGYRIEIEVFYFDWVYLG